MIKRSSGQRQKYVYADSVRAGQMEDTPEAIARWKAQVEGLRSVRLTKMNLVSMAKQLNPCDNVLQGDLETWKIQPKEFTDRIIFMSMFNDLVWITNDENSVSNAEEFKNYAERFLAGHWTFLGPSWVQPRKKWYGSSNHSQKGQWKCPADKMGHLVFKRCQCPESWDLEAEEKVKVPYTLTEILWTQNSCSNNSFCKSAQCLRSRGSCQFGSTEDEKERESTKVLLWTTRFWKSWNQKKYNSWYLFRHWQLETGCDRTLWASRR